MRLPGPYAANLAGRFTCGLLAGWIGISVMNIGLCFFMLRINMGGIRSTRDLARWCFFECVLLAAIGVAFCCWIGLAHRYLKRLGAGGLRYSPVWAVASLFIPVLGLIVPVLVVQEIWRASDPHVPPGKPTEWKSTRSSVLVYFWWPMWLAALAAYAYLSWIWFDSYSYPIPPAQPAAVRTVLFAVSTDFLRSWIIADGLSLMAAGAALVMIWRIGTRQKAKWLQVRQLMPS